MRTVITQCFYHPMNKAVIACTACRRPLCPSCDHRIRGFPYCEDCIVRGIDMLRRPRYGYAPEPRAREHSPRIAALCALIPGLGAVYNRQHVKAIVHFLMTVGLLELADLTGLGIFGVAGAVFYIFSIIDAYRTGQAVKNGLNPAEEDERLREMLMARMHVLALILIGLGVLFLVSDVLRLLDLSLSLRRLWPLFLIGIGAYLIGHYYRSRKASVEVAPDFRRRPPSLFLQSGRLTGTLEAGSPIEGSSPPSNTPGQ